MDKRGLTTDPNRNFGAPANWWESLGPTQKPSPYEAASWQYLQNYETEVLEIAATPAVVYDNGTDFSIYLYPTVFDGGLFNPVVAPTVVLDGGGFADGHIIEFRTITNATVYVYDVLASYPNVTGIYNIVLNTGNLATDPDGELITAEDGIGFDSERNAQTFDDTPPGTLLGELNYTIDTNRADITGWSHYNWMDATPVERAFKAMISGLPHCVTGIYVKDDPTAFWISLGFKYENKGDEELKFFPVTYRGY